MSHAGESQQPGLPFVKMSGGGNDFIVVTAEVAASITDLPRWVRAVCRRGLSVGADGVLVVGGSPGRAVTLAHYNADGGRSELCGNGTRCAARFALTQGWGGVPLRIETDAGAAEATFAANGEVSVRLEGTCARPQRVDLDLGEGGRVSGFFVRVGIPHFVTRVAAIASAPVGAAGPAIRGHASFGHDGTNVSFIAPRPDRTFDIRTYERGVEGETLACGTGCVAAAAVAVDQGWTSSPVTCHTASGIDLTVRLVPTGGGFGELSLTGDARMIYSGRVHPEALSWGRAGDSG